MSRGKRQTRRPGRRRKQPKKKPIDPIEFWGDPSKLPSVEQNVRITLDPPAVVRSLGRPPLSGHHGVAEHYFKAVYDRSVALASALAAAGDLIEPDELMNDRR